MRWPALMLLLALLLSRVESENLATAQTVFTAKVYPQAAIHVDAQDKIVSIYNTTDGTGRQPEILHIFRNSIKIPMNPVVQAELDSITRQIDWSRGGYIYRSTIVIILCIEVGTWRV